MEHSSNALASKVPSNWRDRLNEFSEAIAKGTKDASAAVSTSSLAVGSTEGSNELIDKLTKQLKRAEEACQRVEAREIKRVEVLKQCLVACCAKESPEVLESVLEIAAIEEPDVEKDVAGFRDLLIARSQSDVEYSLERVANLEQQLKEERAERTKAEEARLIAENRLKTREESWELGHERFVEEHRKVEHMIEERLEQENDKFKQVLRNLESNFKQRLTSEATKWHDRVKLLESTIEKERATLRQRQGYEAKATPLKPSQEQQEEISQLKRRVHELESGASIEMQLISMAREQANREKIVESLEGRIQELELQVSVRDRELSLLRNHEQLAIPVESLGPARMDYLRHCILRYMTFDRVAEKQTLIPVISLLLNFSIDEKKLCEASTARDAAKEGVLGKIADNLTNVNLFASSPKLPPGVLPPFASPSLGTGGNRSIIPVPDTSKGAE